MVKTNSEAASFLSVCKVDNGIFNNIVRHIYKDLHVFISSPMKICYKNRSVITMKNTDTARLLKFLGHVFQFLLCCNGLPNEYMQ